MLRREDAPDVPGEPFVLQTQPSLALSPSRLPTELSSLAPGPMAVIVEAPSDMTEEHAETGVDHSLLAARTGGQEKRADKFIAQPGNHEASNKNIKISQKSEITQDTANSVAKSVERMFEEMRNIRQKLGPDALHDILGEILLEKNGADETRNKNDGD